MCLRNRANFDSRPKYKEPESSPATIAYESSHCSRFCFSIAASTI